MRATLHMLKIATALGVLSAVTLLGTAFAAKLTAARFLLLIVDYRSACLTQVKTDYFYLESG